MVIFDVRRVALRRSGALMGYACLFMLLSIIATAPARASRGRMGGRPMSRERGKPELSDTWSPC
jgi:hypothetical protein